MFKVMIRKSVLSIPLWWTLERGVPVRPSVRASGDVILEGTGGRALNESKDRVSVYLK